MKITSTLTEHKLITFNKEDFPLELREVRRQYGS